MSPTSDFPTPNHRGTPLIHPSGRPSVEAFLTDGGDSDHMGKRIVYRYQRDVFSPITELVQYLSILDDGLVAMVLLTRSSPCQLGHHGVVQSATTNESYCCYCLRKIPDPSKKGK